MIVVLLGLNMLAVKPALLVVLGLVAIGQNLVVPDLVLVDFSHGASTVALALMTPSEVLLVST